MRPLASISKFIPPLHPKVLPRPRLFNLLEKNRDKKLILIFGQAGQGKTALMASFAKNSSLPFAWINLEKVDSDPKYLFQSLIYALEYALKDFDPAPIISHSSFNNFMQEKNYCFEEWINILIPHIQNPLRLILDGLDKLTFDSSSYKFLQRFIHLIPPTLQIILVSREEPPHSFEFQDLRMRQLAFALKNEDLAFTKEEVREFFYYLQKIHLNYNQIEKIYSITDGWTAGLVLLSEVLSFYPESVRKQLMDRDLPERFKSDVFRYFEKEIFNFQPLEIQNFLLKSSVVDMIDPDFVKKLTGINNAEGILKELLRKHLFIKSFYDEKKGWLYQYHSIFKEFLKTKFYSEVGEEERFSIFKRTAQFYEESNDLERAIPYLLEAKVYDKAVSILEKIGLELLKVGKINTLSSWLKALPDHFIRGNPWLLCYYSMTKRFTDVEENILNLQSAFTLFEKNKEVRGILLSLAFLIEAIALKGHDSIPLMVLIERAEEVLSYRITEAYPYERAVLFLQLGFGLIYRGKNQRKGFSACQRAYTIARRLGDLSLRINAMINGIQSLCWLGEFNLAREKLKELQKLIGEHSETSIRVMYQLCLSEYSFFKGEFKKAGELIQIIKNEIEPFEFSYLTPYILIHELMLKPHFGQYQEAEKIGLQLMDITTSLNNSFLKGLTMLFLGRNFYFEGHDEKAKEFLDGAFQLLSSVEVQAEYPLALIAVLKGFIYSHLKQNGEMESELRSALSYFESLSSVFVVESHLSLALLKYSLSQINECIQHLEAGLKISKEKGLKNFILMNSRDLVKIVILVFELQIKEHMDYAGDLLKNLAPLQGESELKKFASHPDKKIREKILEVRRTIHRSVVPRLRIETLGTFRVFRGEKLIEEREWIRQKPKELLKAILSHGTGPISKEILIEDLWPEEEQSVSENNFKITLHRLRKILEPTLLREFGSSYIHLHGDEIILDRDLCWVDYWEFLSLMREGEELEKRHEEKKALSFYIEAIRLYKGDFLSGSSYSLWSDKKREELRNEYIKILHKAGNLYDQMGSFRKAVECFKKIIEVDPLLEEYYQKLMTLYATRGMYNQALLVYKSLQEILKKELNTKPDGVTEAIYHNIIQKTDISPSFKK